MTIPGATPYNVVLHTQATVNGKIITFQEAIPAHHWGTLSTDAQEGIKNMVRRELGVAIGTVLNAPVTVTHGEPQVMTTSETAPGHGGPVRVTSESVERPVSGEVVDVPRVTLVPEGGIVLHLPDTTYIDTQVWSVDVGLTPQAFQALREALLPRAAARAGAFREASQVVYGMDTDPGTQAAAEELARMADCPACAAGIEHQEHCPTPETHNAGCGCPPYGAGVTERVERGRAQLVDAMSAVSEERHGLWWVAGLDRRLYSEGGMWETLGRTYGWPVGYYERWTWMSWDDAGALYAGTVAAG